jgi:hypothetical protein
MFSYRIFYQNHFFSLFVTILWESGTLMLGEIDGTKRRKDSVFHIPETGEGGSGDG